MDQATLVIELIGFPLKMNSRCNVELGIILALQSSSGREVRKASTLIIVSNYVLYFAPFSWFLAIGCQSSVLKYRWGFRRIISNANANDNIVDRVVHQPGRRHPYLCHPEVTCNAKGLAS